MTAEHSRDDLAHARTDWEAAAPTLRRADPVFVDESGVATNMVRHDGQAAGGRRVRASVPHGRWERLTILGCLTLGGLTVCLAAGRATDARLMPA